MSITARWNSFSKLTRNTAEVLSLAILLTSVLWMSRCGGGGSKTSTTTTPVALTITSAASTVASEGTVYTYALSATGPASTAISFGLVSSPEGAQISGNVLTWTPSHSQSRVTNAFEVKAATPAGASASQKFSVTPLGTIRGTAVNTYVTAEGNITGAEDLTKVYIGASVPDGGSWRTIQGVAKSDGTFEIQGVPAGSYWFATASGGYWTSAGDLDLGQDFLGRKDGQLPVTPTYLDLHLEGLVPWESADTINIYNANLGQNFDWSDNNNPGDTSTASLWNWTGPLSDASHGDAWYATQLGTTKEAEDTDTWRYIENGTSGISINQTDGSTTPLSATLTKSPTVNCSHEDVG